MRIEAWYIGKTAEQYLKDGCSIFEKRIKRFLPFEVVVIPDVKNGKNAAPAQLKQLEGEKILSKLGSDDFLVLLDEKGKQFTSREFASQLNRWTMLSHKRLIFLIGGAFGFSDKVYDRSNAKLSLSKMTFSHQMIRLFLLEQIYRGMAIQKNLPYHND